MASLLDEMIQTIIEEELSNIALDEKKDDKEEKRDKNEIPLQVNFKGSWVRPDRKHIQDQTELAACLNDLDYKVLVSKINKASPMELDNHTWAELSNTNSFGVGTADQAKDIADQYGYHYNDAMYGYMNDREITMPVILDIDNGSQFYMVSGEPELLFARAFKVAPQVLVVKI
jgi:hypothetical protein